MNIESFRDFCIKKKGVTESFPFDNETIVYKVGGRIFALTNIDSFESVNLKCDPDYALELREHYQAVSPGYHMNKKHWNTVKINGSLKDSVIFQWIDQSYALVLKGLPAKVRENL
jgi:predicted DNA-binding protein (MmcQ/YjbR family)